MQTTKIHLLISSVLASALIVEGSVGHYPFFGGSIFPAFPHAFSAAFPPVSALPAPVPALPAPVPAVPAAVPVPAAFPITPKVVRFAPPSVPPYAYSVNVVTRALTPPASVLLPPLGAQPLPGFNLWRR